MQKEELQSPVEELRVWLPGRGAMEGAALQDSWEQLLQALLELPCWYSSGQRGSSQLCEMKAQSSKVRQFLVAL